MNTTKTASEAKAAKTSTIGRATFRDAARKAVAKYEQRGMMVDALVWGRIVADYEDDRTRMLAALNRSLHLIELCMDRGEAPSPDSPMLVDMLEEVRAAIGGQS